MAIKRMFKLFVDSTMVPLVSYLRRSTAPTNDYSVLVELQRRASIESADYAQERMTHAIAFESRGRLLEEHPWRGGRWRRPVRRPQIERCARPRYV